MPKKTEFSQFSIKKKAFVEHYIQTHNVTESYFAAGYLADLNRNDPKVRKRAYQSGAEILKSPVVQHYIETHKPIPIPVEGYIDDKAITDRLMHICMGTIEQQYLIKGNLVWMKPTFKESIEAGKVLLQIVEKREKKEPLVAKKALSSRLQQMVSGARMIDAPKVEIDLDEEDGGVEQ